MDGEWRWVVGPEAGTLFWIGGPAGTQILFADWAPGEPNNAFGPGSESRLGWSELGWNDLPASGFGSTKAGYIVEFSGVPEPSTLLLLGAGLIGFAGLRKNAIRPSGPGFFSEARDLRPIVGDDVLRMSEAVR